MHAATDLLIGGEGDADGAVGDVGIAQQVVGQRHDDGDAGLVIRAQEGGSAGGDDVVADLLGQVGKVRWGEDGVGIVGEDDVAASVLAMDDRLDAGPVEGGRRVHMRQKRDGWRMSRVGTVAGMVARTAP